MMAQWSEAYNVRNESDQRNLSSSPAQGKQILKEKLHLELHLSQYMFQDFEEQLDHMHRPVGYRPVYNILVWISDTQ